MTTTKTATGAVVDFIQSARLADFPADAAHDRQTLHHRRPRRHARRLDAGRGPHPPRARARRRSAHGRDGVRAAAVQDRRGLGRARQRHERPRARLGRHAALDERRSHLRPADAPDACRRSSPRSRSASGSASSGAQFLEAFLTGFEVECKIAEAIHPNHYKKGFHSSGTIGTFGAAVGGGEAARPRRGADGAHARDRRELGVRHPRQLRHA